MSKISALLAQAAVIRDATAEKENTALRVGSMFVSFVQAVLDTMPPEVIDATGISLASAADKITVTLKTMDEDGTAGTRSIVIPTATADKAGLLSPATLKAMSKAVEDVATAVQAATDAVTTANAAKTTAGLAQGRANFAVNTAETASTTAGEAKTAADAAVNTAATAKTTADKASTTASHTAALLAGLHILPVDGIGIVGDDIFPSEAPGIYWDTEDREFIGQPDVNGYEQRDYFAQDADGDWIPRTDRIYSCGGALYHIVDGQMVPLHQGALDALAARVSTAEKRLAGVAILPIDATVNLGTVAGAQQEGVRFDTRAGAFVGDFAAAGYAETDYNELYSESEMVVPTWRARRDRIYRCGTELYIMEGDKLVGIHSAAIKGAKTDLLRKLWIDACKSVCRSNVTYGGVNADGLPVLYDEVLTWDEAIHIYNISHKSPMHLMTRNAYIYGDKLGRFFLPLRVTMHECNMSRTFQGCATLEAIALDAWSGINLSPGEGAFEGCSKLKRIIGNFHSAYGDAALSNIFKGCRALQEVRFWSNTSFSFVDSPLLSRASVAETLKRTGTNAITITVHADVYAKLTGDTTNAAAAALTAEELAAWQQIVTDAAQKNISFATV